MSATVPPKTPAAPIRTHEDAAETGALPSLAGDVTAEIAALIETLSQADRRLEELTGGEVDAFVTQGGRTVMLQRSQDLLRQHEQARKTNSLIESQQAAALLSVVFSSTPDHIFVKDRSGRYLQCNEALANFAGRGVEEMIGRTNALVGIETKGVDGEGFGYALTDVDRRVMSTGEPVTSEDVLRGADGPRTFLSTRSPFRNVPGEIVGVIGISRDITDRKLAELETQHLAERLAQLNAELETRVLARTADLTSAREDAEQANRAKSAFLATMSHEIRTPMNGVVGLIDVLGQSSLSASQADIVRTIRESACALLGIVDDVLDFSKIEAGRLEVEHEPMSIERVVSQVHETLDRLAHDKGVRLSVRLDRATPAQVLGDAPRLRQVLMNLIGNAIKFSSGTGRVGRVDLDVRMGAPTVGDAGCAASFIVADNGIGMDEPTIGRLFQPFAQADASTTRRFGGTGLGLSISGRIAQMMGGRIEVVSAPGTGSRFTLALPFDCASAGALEAEQRPFVRVDSDFQALAGNDVLGGPLSHATAGRLILVAEDNETNQFVIRKQLDLMGYGADTAATGEEALRMWRSGRYALVLTDLHMPVMDGFELAAAIRADEAPGNHVPIVALTADAARSEVLRGRTVGIDDHMVKPVRLSELHDVLKRWMPADSPPKRLRAARREEWSSGREPFRAAAVALDEAAAHSPVIPAVPAQATPEVKPAQQPSTAPAVDLAVLASLVGTDSVITHRILAAFRKGAAQAKRSARRGVASDHHALVAEAAHKLKSSARAIGAMRLASTCHALEDAANRGQHAEMSALLGRFEQHLAEVDAFLETRRR